MVEYCTTLCGTPIDVQNLKRWIAIGWQLIEATGVLQYSLAPEDCEVSKPRKQYAVAK
jgi:hypothetical protein